MGQLSNFGYHLTSSSLVVFALQIAGQDTMREAARCWFSVNWFSVNWFIVNWFSVNWFSVKCSVGANPSFPRFG
jgi:hypothetical protein